MEVLSNDWYSLHDVMSHLGYVGEEEEREDAGDRSEASSRPRTL